MLTFQPKKTSFAVIRQGVPCPEGGLVVATTGHLRARSQGGGLFKGGDLVIIDEAHERSPEMFMLVRQVQQDGAQLAMMSATPECLHVVGSVQTTVMADERARRHHAESVPLPGRDLQDALLYNQTHHPAALERVLVIFPTLNMAEDAAVQGMAQLPGVWRVLSRADTAWATLPARFESGHIAATTVADAGVTIPGVTLVVDLGKEIVQHDGHTMLSWARPFIKEQRKGRTGGIKLTVYCGKLHFFFREMHHGKLPKHMGN